jgi:hypothetical protein
VTATPAMPTVSVWYLRLLLAVWRGVQNTFPPFGTCLVRGNQRTRRRRAPDGYWLRVGSTRG